VPELAAPIVPMASDMAAGEITDKSCRGGQDPDREATAETAQGIAQDPAQDPGQGMDPTMSMGEGTAAAEPEVKRRPWWRFWE
jgi:hypothetical protein